MTDTSRRPSVDSGRYDDGPTAWAGWVAFAGVMLIVLGAFQLVQGLVALFDDGFYAVRPDGLIVNVDYNTWGWLHTGIGIIGVLTGIGLLAGNMVARIVGVAVAALSAVTNLVFISAYPVWSMIMIAIDVIIIFAIVVHGRELKDH